MKTRKLLLTTMLASIAVISSFAQTVITATVGSEAVTLAEPVSLANFTINGVATDFAYLGDLPSGGFTKADQIIDFTFDVTTAGVYFISFEYLNRSSDIDRGEYVWVNGYKLAGDPAGKPSDESPIDYYPMAPTPNVGGAWTDPQSTGINSRVGAVYFKKGLQKVSIQSNWGYTYYKSASVTLATAGELATTAGITINAVTGKEPDGVYVVPVNSDKVSFTGEGIRQVTTPNLPIPLSAMWGESSGTGGKFSQQTIYVVSVPSAGVYSIGVDHINTTGNDERATHVIINNCMVANLPSYVTGRAVIATTAGGVSLGEFLEDEDIYSTPYIGVIGRTTAGNFNLNAGENTIRLRSAWGYMWFGSLHVSPSDGTVTGCNVAAISTITGSTSFLQGKTSKYILQASNPEALNTTSVGYTWSVSGSAATIVRMNTSKTQVTLSGVNAGVVELTAAFDSDPTIKYTLVVTITGLTSTTDELSSLVSVYPNPSTGVVNVSTDGLTGVKVAVYDIIGNLVKASSSETTFSLSNAGVYIVEVKTSQGVTRKRIIVE